MESLQWVAAFQKDCVDTQQQTQRKRCVRRLSFCLLREKSRIGCCVGQTVAVLNTKSGSDRHEHDQGVRQRKDIPFLWQKQRETQTLTSAGEAALSARLISL